MCSIYVYNESSLSILAESVTICARQRCGQNQSRGPEDRQTDDDIVGLDDDTAGTNDDAMPAIVDNTGAVGDVVMLLVYNYTRGNCPDPGNSTLAVPCAPDDLGELCDKYENNGSLSKIF